MSTQAWEESYRVLKWTINKFCEMSENDRRSMLGVGPERSNVIWHRLETEAKAEHGWHASEISAALRLLANGG